ncbi:MAG: hypothetical protein AAF696_31045 [Bacteroidota bacterium]
MFSLIRSSIFLCLMAVITCLPAQIIKDSIWLEDNDRGNRFEGAYKQKIANPSLELVSFYAGFESYGFGMDQKLKIAFNSPKSASFLIKAEEIETKQFYWMQNKETKLDSGWNEFSPWPVDLVLKDMDIEKRNLGIIVKSRQQDSRIYLPAYIYHSTGAEEPKFLALIFRLGASIIGGKLDLFAGKYNAGQKPSPAALLHSVEIGRNIKGADLSFKLPKGRLEDTASWYHVLLRCKKKGVNELLRFSFNFYYSKNG